jgi:hypothetical protein
MIDIQARMCHTEKLGEMWYIMNPDGTKYVTEGFSAQWKAERDLNFYCTGEDDE